MRVAAFRLKGKFHLLGLGILCLGPACVKDCVAQTVPSNQLVAASPARSLALSKYDVLKTRVTAGDLTVDWVELRTVATEAGFESYDWHPTRERVLKALDEGNLPAALSGAQTVIAHNVANPEGHLLALTVYQQMGMEQAAERERRVIDAIVKSIMTSGDGLSAQHAWSTVSKSEEEFVISMVLDADPESQTIVLADGRTYDRRTVRMEDGGEHILWFKLNSATENAMAAVRLPTR